MDKVSPTQSTQSQQIQPLNSSASTPRKPTIKTPRDLRFIVNIMYGEASTHDLVSSVGSANIWEHCRQLKKRGWIIDTTEKPFIDRDGKKVMSGYYRLAKSQCDIALDAIKAFKEKQEAKSCSK